MVKENPARMDLLSEEQEHALDERIKNGEQCPLDGPLYFLLRAAQGSARAALRAGLDAGPLLAAIQAAMIANHQVI